MQLLILSPEKQILSAEVDYVELPGAQGRFAVLKGHAPLISSLTEGVVRYQEQGVAERQQLPVSGGFVKVLNDQITVCVG